MLDNLVQRAMQSVRGRLTPSRRVVPAPQPSAEEQYLRFIEADSELSLEQKVRYWRREGFILSDLVQDALPAHDRLVVLDVGAREAFRDPRWRGFSPDHIEFIGFEADAVEAARDYVHRAILYAPGFGGGAGPLDHGWPLRTK